MEIKTKLNLYQECYFIEDNKIKSGQVEQIIITIVPHTSCVSYYVSKSFSTIQLDEDSIFRTIDEALDYLRENVQ